MIPVKRYEVISVSDEGFVKLLVDGNIDSPPYVATFEDAFVKAQDYELALYEIKTLRKRLDNALSSLRVCHTRIKNLLDAKKQSS